jgi:hypothetical protein
MRLAIACHEMYEDLALQLLKHKVPTLPENIV